MEWSDDEINFFMWRKNYITIFCSVQYVFFMYLNTFLVYVISDCTVYTVQHHVCLPLKLEIIISKDTSRFWPRFTPMRCAHPSFQAIAPPSPPSRGDI